MEGGPSGPPSAGSKDPASSFLCPQPPCSMRNHPGYNSAHTVSTPSPLRFKIADDPAEFEQIFELAYDTFVEEIPQH